MITPLNITPKASGGWKTFGKNLLIATGVDVLLSAVLLFFLYRATDDVRLVLVVERWLLLAFFAVNACLAVAIIPVRRKLYPILMINSIVSVAIFHLLFYFSFPLFFTE